MTNLTFKVYSSLALILVLALIIWRWVKSVKGKNAPIVDVASTRISQFQSTLPTILTSSQRVTSRDQLAY